MTAAHGDRPRCDMLLMFAFCNGSCHLVRNEYAPADAAQAGPGGRAAGGAR